MASSRKNVRLNQLFTNNFTAMLAMAALFLMIGAQGLFAQSGRANISGTVTDSQGAVVSGATVTATNAATGVATPTTSNGSGAYNILQIIPGTYTLKVEKEGFGSQERQNVTLTAEQNLGADFALQPGKVSEKVTVEAGAELVHTETAELSQTINEHSITELPLNGRNPASLVLLTPGTVDMFATPGGGAQTYTTFPTDSAASTNGGRQGSTLYLLDGAYNEDNYVLAAAPFPNPDAVQEFTVIGNNFDPRYGFAPGGVVSIVTKSGTNNWHGDAFEFYRNGGFNAKDYFTHLTNQVHRNQFGGSLGGPVLKDKFFVFGNYQGTRQSIFNASSTGYVWTPAMINNGDFSAYCTSGFATSGPLTGLCNDRDANGLVEHQIYVANPGGYPDKGVPLSQITAPGFTGFYPGNQIPVASFSPQAVALANAISGGLTPQNAFGSVLGAGYPTLTPFNEFTVRGDYNLNDHNRISARAFDNFFNQPAYSGGNAVSTNRSWIVNWQDYAGTWTWTINPHIVNNVTSSYSRMYDSSNSGLIIGGKRICFSQFTAISDPSTTPCSIEGLSINGGYQSAGGFPINAQNFNGINRWTWSLSESVSVSKGKHLMVAGVDVLRQYWYENTDWLALAIVSFGGGTSGQFTGNGFSDFLLGDMNNNWQGGGESNAIHAWMIAPYFADQIKLKSNLTLSVGVRWEPWIAPVVTNGRISMYNPGQQSTRYPNAPNGLIFPGDAGVPSAGTKSDYARFLDPRVGLAWSPKALPNTSIRAAFGMYATPIDYSSYNHASDLAPFSPTYNYSTNQTVTDQNGVSSVLPIIPFAAPWSVYTPLGGVNPFPPFSNPGTNPGASAVFFPPIDVPSGFSKNFTDGRTYTWNTSIEHQFGANWLVKAAYVASESDHQSFANDANLGVPICGPVSESCPLRTTNPARVNQLFTQVLLDYATATANYQSGQFTLEKRFNHGLQFTANYTYSKTIDIADSATTAFNGNLDNPGCVKCNRGNSFIDTPQVFVANFIYETPSLGGWNRATKLALGGWQLSGIYRAQSGQAFSIYCGCNTSWQVASSDYPDYVSAKSVQIQKASPGNLSHYLNGAEFTNAPQGRDGNIGRNPTGAFGPGINTWDLNMSKNFHFTERYAFQFRWEMYNAFNRVTFANPNNNTASSNFGLINSTNGNFPSRVIQAGAKFIF
jgi:hypothetical protein